MSALALVAPPGKLLSVERARELLARSRDVDEVKDIRDKAKAVAMYQRATRASVDAQNDALEVELRAERRLGELVREMPKSTGGDAARARSQKATEVDRDAPPTLASLGIDKRESARWQNLAAIPASMFDALIKETRDKAERLKRNAPLKLAKLESKARLAAELRAKPLPVASGRFDIIVADPPWAYEKRADDITGRGRISYPSMPTDAICALPVAARSEESCILWLWTTNAFMRDALRVVDAWDFAEKTILTWVKDRMGLGDWLRGQTEHCILAVRGRPLVQLTNETTVLRGPVREHSRKPDEFFELVDRLCPGTKLEMFAREARSGWVAWGAEPEMFGAR